MTTVIWLLMAGGFVGPNNAPLPKAQVIERFTRAEDCESVKDRVNALVLGPEKDRLALRRLECIEAKVAHK